MRLASFNVENLFQRAKVMNQSSWQDGKEVLKAFTLTCLLTCLLTRLWGVDGFPEHT